MSEEEQKHLQRKRRNRMRMRALQREEREIWWIVRTLRTEENAMQEHRVWEP